MTSASPPADGESAFDYPLAALLRQRGMELDEAKAELARSRERARLQAHALEAQTAQRSALEDLQRQESRAGADIDVSSRLRLQDCVRAAQLREADYAADLDRAQAEQDSAIEKVRLARLTLKANERHRERALARVVTEQARSALRVADDTYLMTAWPNGESTSGQ